MRIFSASIQRILSKSNPNANYSNQANFDKDELSEKIVDTEKIRSSQEKIFSNPVYDYSHLEEYEQYQTRRETHSLDMSEW